MSPVAMSHYPREPPHTRSMRHPVPAAPVRLDRIHKDLGADWVLPDGESLRKKFTFISTANGEKLKSERVIINEFGTPMEIAIINPENEWSDDFLRSLDPAPTSQYISPRTTVRNALPKPTGNQQTHHSRRPTIPNAGAATGKTKSRKSPHYNSRRDSPKAVRVESKRAVKEEAMEPVSSPPRVRLLARLSDWELVPPSEDILEPLPGPAAKTLPVSPEVRIPAPSKAQDIAPKAVTAATSNVAPPRRQPDAWGAPQWELVPPPHKARKPEPIISSVSKAPTIPPHLRARSDPAPAPATNTPKVVEDSWVPGAPRKKFTFISTADREELKKERLVTGSDSESSSSGYMSHDSKTRSGGQVNLSPSPGPVSTTTTDVPSVHSPALTDQVHQSASTIFKSPVPSRATKSPQESVGPKSIIYQDGAEFLKVLEDLVKQGSAAVEVGVGDGVVMRFSPSVSHLSTASVSPTSSTNPSSVSSKPSKASDFAKEAIKRLETVQGMRTTIVGGHNKPVDSGPVNDLDANKTVKSTIVGGHNKPVDTEPVSDLDDEKIVKSAIAGGLMDYNKPVDTRIARETSGPAKRIMEMKRAILGGHAAYYNKPVDASSYQKETAHAIKKEAVPALKQKPAPIPKKATPVAKEEAPRATKATAPIPKAPVVSDAEEVAAPASKGSGPKLSVDEAVRLSLKDPAQFWGYWPAPTPRAPRPPRTRQPKYCPIKGWKNDRRGSHDHLY